MRRQARAIDEYIPCAISWPKNMVDGWSRQARTMCSLGSTSNHACLSTRVHKFVYKQDSPSTSIFSPQRKALPFCKAPLPRRMQMLRGWPRARSRPDIQGPSEYLDKRGGNAGSAVDPPLFVLSQPWRNAGWRTDRLELDFAETPSPLGRPKRTEQPDQRGNLPLTNYQLVTFTHRQILPRYLKMGDTYLAQDSCIVLKLNTQITLCSICTVNLYCIADILL